MKKQILTNLGSNYLFSFFGMALGFFLVPFLIGKLGKEAFGLTVLAESTALFFEILTVSVRVALSRHATFALSAEKMDDFTEYLSTGRVILYGSSAMVLAFGLVVSALFTHIFKVPPVYALDSQILFLLISLGFVISIPNIVFWSVLYAKQRFDLINLSMSVGLVLRAVFLFAYYSFAPKEWQTLTAYGAIYFSMAYVQNQMIYRWSHKVMPELSIRFRSFKRERVREILSFSIHTSMTRASQLLYQETAHILMNVLWGPAYNAVYSIALKLPNTMRRIFLEPSWALTPTFTDLAAKGDKKRMEELLYFYSKVLTIVTTPMSFALMFFSAPIIQAWVGPDFQLAGELMPLFSISLFVAIPFSLSGCLMNAFGKMKVPSFVSLATAVLNVLLCLGLGHWLGWRLYGIAWATVISSLWLSTFFFPYYACQVAGISWWSYALESMIKPFALASVSVGVGFWMFRFTPWTGNLTWMMAGAASLVSLVYYVVAYFLLFSASEKVHTRDLFGAALRRVS